MLQATCWVGYFDEANNSKVLAVCLKSQVLLVGQSYLEEQNMVS